MNSSLKFHHCAIHKGNKIVGYMTAATNIDREKNTVDIGISFWNRSAERLERQSGNKSALYAMMAKTKNRNFSCEFSGRSSDDVVTVFNSLPDSLKPYIFRNGSLCNTPHDGLKFFKNEKIDAEKNIVINVVPIQGVVEKKVTQLF